MFITKTKSASLAEMLDAQRKLIAQLASATPRDWQLLLSANGDETSIKRAIAIVRRRAATMQMNECSVHENRLPFGKSDEWIVWSNDPANEDQKAPLNDELARAKALSAKPNRHAFTEYKYRAYDEIACHQSTGLFALIGDGTPFGLQEETLYDAEATLCLVSGADSKTMPIAVIRARRTSEIKKFAKGDNPEDRIGTFALAGVKDVTCRKR